VVERGAPYQAELAAMKSLGVEGSALAPLEWQSKQFDGCWYVSIVLPASTLVPTWLPPPGGAPKMVHVAPAR